MFSDPIFQDSEVVDYGDANTSKSTIDKKSRNSRSAYLPLPADPPTSEDELVIQCIEERASRFQGHAPQYNMENLQVVKY